MSSRVKGARQARIRVEFHGFYVEHSMRQALLLSNEATGVMAQAVWIRMNKRGHRARGEPGQKMRGVK